MRLGELRSAASAREAMEGCAGARTGAAGDFVEEWWWCC